MLERVDGHPGLADLEMEVRTGGPARVADQTDLLALAYLLALSYLDHAQMSVESGDSPAMVNLHSIAIPDIASGGEGHHAVGRCHHRYSHVAHDVDAGVAVLT